MFRRLWRPSPRTGLDRLREMTESVPPYQTSRWELDVADLPSQNETVAWKRYRELLRETDHPYEPVVYGRYVERESGRALQYWYLYLYNDFRNNHEGDWEMVTIELSDESAPLRVAYSAHIHGFVQECHKVRKHEIDVGRPLLYVARGSHAGYFSYEPKGYRALRLSYNTNPPRWGRALAAVARNVPGLRRWRDFTAADPNTDVPKKPAHLGSRLEPRLRIVPDDDPQPGSEWWWLRLQCAWGSTHTRVLGTTGPKGPWAAPPDALRWHDPVGWIDKLERT